jgi:hypothetical protein
VGNEGGELPEPANGVIASIAPQEELPDLIERNPRNPGRGMFSKAILKNINSL